ncbi:rpsA [Mucuna pruriens]|uniref:RpsA n=1 Tax=Mucuna pruriens TaxID=157652 RepID=A0A371GD15_MUCPR|nr:rpsA [Mucuna pruriens]
MGSLPLTSKPFFTQLHWFSSHRTTKPTTISLNQRLKVSASLSRKEEENDSPYLDSHDLMELKFGRLLGEDPKLTLAKIMGRKANPDASYLDIEKAFHKRGNKVVEVEQVPFDGSKGGKSSRKLDDLGLVRPVPPKGVKFKADDNKPVLEIKKPIRTENPEGSVRKSSVPNVILRKPTVFKEDGDDDTLTSRLRMKPNLSLKMQDEKVKEKFSDMTLLRKPETPVAKNTDTIKEPSSRLYDQGRDDGELEKFSDMTLLRKPETPVAKNTDPVEEPSSHLDDQGSDDGELEKFSDMTLLRKPETPVSKNVDMIEEPSRLDDQGSDDGELEMWNEEPSDEISGFTLLERPHKSSGEKEEKFGEVNVMVPNDGLEQHEQRQLEFHEELTDLTQLSDLKSVDYRVELPVEAALQAKPKRLDQYVKQTSKFVGEEGASLNLEGQTHNDDLGNVVDVSDFQESEDADWIRAEGLVKTGDRGDVELVSCNTKGFIVSFGSLVGFLPYRNLASKWKFLAFESWLKQKGLDPSMYKQNSGTITSFDAENKNFSPDSPPYLEIDGKVEDKISPDMKLEDLLRIYDQEKIKFLSSFIGQKIKANVLVADRKMRKLIFSLRRKEKEELVEKKRNLMQARLQVGDIVKCHVQKIAYFGIFVEVEGVSALIHQSELSWDATLNPASYFKIGQVLEAKVHQLNFALERIFLSLKEIMPDPLMNSLESIVGDHDPLDGRLEAAQTDVEMAYWFDMTNHQIMLTFGQWSEVDSLIEELLKIEGVQSVSKGRFFRSPGLAPTFQVYMASIFENQYKLLARSGNKIQEGMFESWVSER